MNNESERIPTMEPCGDVYNFQPPFGFGVRENRNKIPKGNLKSLVQELPEVTGILIDIPIAKAEGFPKTGFYKAKGFVGQKDNEPMLTGDPTNLEEAHRMIEGYNLNYFVSHLGLNGGVSPHPIIDGCVLTHIETTDEEIALINYSSSLYTTKIGRNILERVVLYGDKTSYPVIDGICKKTIILGNEKVPIFGQTKTEIFNDEKNVIKTVGLKKGWSSIFSPYFHEALVRNNREAKLIKKYVSDTDNPVKKYKIHELFTSLDKEGIPRLDSVIVYLGKTANQKRFRQIAPWRNEYTSDGIYIGRHQISSMMDTDVTLPVVQHFAITKKDSESNYEIDMKNPLSEKMVISSEPPMSESYAHLMQYRN